MSAENGGSRGHQLLGRRAGVALLRLDRPEARNAIDTQMLVELLEHLAVARADDAVRVLAISSSDHMGLSAGADVKEQLDEEGKVRRMQLFADLYDGIVGFPKPTVAACHGDVVGGGAEIAVACDMRVAGSNLRMRFPGAALGVPVGPARLVSLCGLAAAKYLLLTRARSAPTRRCGSGSSTASRRRRRPRRRRSSSPPRSRPTRPRPPPASSGCCTSGTMWSAAPPARARARSSGSASGRACPTAADQDGRP